MQLLVRGVGGDAGEPAAEDRLDVERANLARRRRERVLCRLLCVPVGAGDAPRESVHAVAEALDQLLGGIRTVAAERLDELGVDVGARARQLRQALPMSSM